MENLCKINIFYLFRFWARSFFLSRVSHWIHYVLNVRSDRVESSLQRNSHSTPIFETQLLRYREVSLSSVTNRMKKCLEKLRTISLCFKTGFSQANEHLLGIYLMVPGVILYHIWVQLSVIKRYRKGPHHHHIVILFPSEVLNVILVGVWTQH